MTFKLFINGPINDKAEGGPIWVIDVVDMETQRTKAFKTMPQIFTDDELLIAVPTTVSLLLKEIMKDKLCQPH